MRSSYRIISLRGRGGMGEVFLADDLTLGQPVALKFLPESMIDKSMLERFRNEARIARCISRVGLKAALEPRSLRPGDDSAR